MTGYLCNLVLPGAAKSGTSSLCAMLDQHPDICVSDPKEPQFFSFDERFRLGAAGHNRFYSHCRGHPRYYADGSQCYFTHEWAIERIARSIVDPKIIIMMRHPVERAISQYRSNVRRGIEKDPFDKAVEERGEERGYFYIKELGVYDAIGGYLAFSRYSRWVPVWRERFGSENLLVLKYKDFSADAGAIVRRCLDFLALPRVAVRNELRNATSTTLRTIPPLALRLAARLLPDGLRKSRLYEGGRRLLLEPITPNPEEVSPELRRHLEDKLADEITFFAGIPSVRA